MISQRKPEEPLAAIPRERREGQLALRHAGIDGLQRLGWKSGRFGES